MSSSSPAILSAAAVMVAAAVWVRPVAISAGSRPRVLVAPSAPAPLGPLPCPAWFLRAADRAALPAPLERWWAALLASLVPLAAGGYALGGPVFGVVVALAGPAAAVGWLYVVRDRRDTLLARSVPDTLDAIARSSRAGLSVVQALEALQRDTATPSDRLFGSIATSVHRGESLRSSLEVLIADTHLPAVRLAATALLVSSDTGAAPAKSVEGVAATLRDRAALDREAAAHSSQAKASVGVLVLAPVGFGSFAIATDPRVGEFLFRSPVGLVCLGLGLALDALGAWWMSRIMEDAR